MRHLSIIVLLLIGSRVVSEQPSGRSNLQSSPIVDNEPQVTSRPLPHPAGCAAFSSNGKILASGGRDDGAIIIWEAATGKQLRKLQGDKGWVNSVAFSTDGKLIESRTWANHPKAWEDETITLWETATGKEVFKLRAPKGGWGLDFSPDRATLALAKWEKTIRLIEVATGRELRKLEGHEDWVKSLAFSRDGKTLASASSDLVCLWDVTTGNRLAKHKWQGHEVERVMFCSDGTFHALTRTRDERRGDRLHVLDLTTGRGVPVLGTVAPNGRYCAAWVGLGPCVGGALGLSDGGLRLHALPCAQIGRSGPLVFAPTSVGLQTSLQTAFAAWDEGLNSPREPLLWGQIPAAGPLVFSADSRLLATSWGPGLVQIWEVLTERQLVQINVPEGVHSLAFSPDGKALVMVGAKRIIIQPLTPFRGHGGSVSALAFSADAARMTAADVTGVLAVSEIATGKQLLKFRGHEKGVFALAYSSDGRMVASASEDGTVRLWRVATGEQLHAIKSDWGLVRYLFFARDGKTLGVDTAANLRLFDVATGQEVDRFPEPASPE